MGGKIGIMCVSLPRCGLLRYADIARGDCPAPTKLTVVSSWSWKVHGAGCAELTLY